MQENEFPPIASGEYFEMYFGSTAKVEFVLLRFILGISKSI